MLEKIQKESYSIVTGADASSSTCERQKPAITDMPCTYPTSGYLKARARSTFLSLSRLLLISSSLTKSHVCRPRR